jgi:hypothetical protein
LVALAVAWQKVMLPPGVADEDAAKAVPIVPTPATIRLTASSRVPVRGAVMGLLGKWCRCDAP